MAGVPNTSTSSEPVSCWAGTVGMVMGVVVGVAVGGATSTSEGAEGRTNKSRL